MNHVPILMGVVIGYCLWNIIHILRTEKKMNRLKSTTAPPNVEDPVTTVHHALTKILNFPESKVTLYNNDTAVAIAYGHSSLVIIDKRNTSDIAIGIVIDKTTKQTEEERDQEFKELQQLLESCGFNEDNFLEPLASLVTKLAHADLTKFTHVHRQIPRDML